MKLQLLKKWKHFFYIAHAVILLIVTLFLQQLLFLYKDEASVIQVSTFAKMLLSGDNKPDPASFLFINTSFDNALVTVFDETGFIPLGNQPITDREKLVELMETIHQNPQHKFLILDVFIEQTTPADEKLERLLNETPRTIAGHFIDEQYQPIQPSIDIPTGAVTVRVLNDEFTKYKLSYSDSVLTLPLKVFLDETNSTYKHGEVVSWIDGVPLLNTFFLNFRVNTYDLKIDKSYPLINLGELLMLGPENIAELTNDRLVVIGDFEANDNIETLFGSIPGPLLLTNVVLALEQMDMKISLPYLLFLLLCFYFLSSIVFNPNDVVGQIIHKIRIGELLQNFIKGMSLIILLSIISILSFLIFHIHVNIMIMSIYLYAVDYLIIRIDKGDNN
ncbi:MAG: CHASE2 domain-containing protein [Cyclobacteriaceae bacterium]